MEAADNRYLYATKPLTMKHYKAAMDNDFLLKILDDSGFI